MTQRAGGHLCLSLQREKAYPAGIQPDPVGLVQRQDARPAVVAVSVLWGWRSCDGAPEPGLVFQRRQHLDASSGYDPGTRDGGPM
jgi:hypothetical protein